MNHFPKGIMLPYLLALFFTANSVQAEHFNQEWGRVNMQGAIIDSACAIAAGSREQAIDMGITPIGDITRSGRGMTRYFSIELINCVLSRAENQLPNWGGFQVIFDGDTDGELFEMHGGVKGVGLQIVDAEGNVAHPGNPIAIRELSPGRMLLNFQIRLIGNKHLLRVGKYYSAIRFKMSYH